MAASWIKLTLALLSPPALSAASWWLAGGTVWQWGSLLSATLLVILAVACLRHPHTLGARDGLLAAWCLACWLAWFAPGHFFPPTTVRLTLDSDEVPEPGSDFRAEYRGREVVRLDQFAPCSFRFRGRFDPASLHLFTRGTLGELPRSFRDFGNRVRVERIDTVALYLDNPTPAPAVVESGLLHHTVPPGGSSVWRLPAPPSDLPLLVALDGRPLAQATPPGLLVDASGRQRYRLRPVVYQHAFSLLPGAEGKREPREGAVLGPARWHALDRPIEFFLAPAPERLAVQTTSPFPPPEERTELIRLPLP